MTKTVCDICGKEANGCCEVPCWSNFKKRNPGFGYDVLSDAKIVNIKLDLCEYHKIRLAEIITGMLCERKE